MKIYIILGALFLILVLLIFILGKICRKLQEEKASLEVANAKQKSNLAYLLKHAQEIAKIEENKDEIEEEIRGAKSDEEVANIINTIIDLNNSRVRKQTEN